MELYKSHSKNIELRKFLQMVNKIALASVGKVILGSPSILMGDERDRGGPGNFGTHFFYEAGTYFDAK